jgi:peptidyl-dipeptidase Dcp
MMVLRCQRLAAMCTILGRSSVHVTTAFSIMARTSGAASSAGARTTTTLATTVCDASTGSESTITGSSTNPLLKDWSNQPFHLPPFQQIQPSHFQEALQEGMRAEMKDLQAIAAPNFDAGKSTPAAATFENTMAAYDRAGSLLGRVGAVFQNMCSSLNTAELQEVQTTMAPLLSRHTSGTYQVAGLFDKMDAVFQKRHDIGLTSEQVRLTERIHMDFTRAGAALSARNQEELADLQALLASMSTKFQQNVMKDEEVWGMELQGSDMTGCPESLVEAAQAAASERGNGEDSYVITLSRSLVEPFLTFSDRRDLRQQAWNAWTSRGEMDAARDNIKIAEEILALRKRVANIHGYKSFAAYQCADRMAQTPEKVNELLENVWTRAKESANKERTTMEEFVASTGVELEGGIEPWDWRFYAEQVRKVKYDFDEGLLKPYLPLDGVTAAFFAVAGNLFGLKFTKLPDIESYHPDVVTYEVHEKMPDGTDRLVSLFIHDNYARAHKSSGAWMSEYRTQTKNLDPSAASIEGVPVVSNNNNFAKSKGQTLLSYDDARTLFHEGGHGLHGMLSNATYGRLAATNVLTDFVELPSQLMEQWFSQPQVLKKYARHYQTGEPIPDELLDKLQAARSFQQGFQTIEYTACAILDMAMHQIEDYTDFDLAEFERAGLEEMGMPKGIVMRHRPAHFQHLFSTDMYAAGYYVYQWAEVLDADAFAAFQESGDIFDPETAAKARKHIYGAGNTVAPDELFRRFRGRDPEINFMLKRKGLLSSD